ncbi:MAG: hypothetical protein ABIJ09_12015 [Pseudomonadota bacterium]
MKRMHIAMACLSVGVLTACPPGDLECSDSNPCGPDSVCVDGTCKASTNGHFDLKFAGESFTANIGKQLRVVVIDLDASNQVVHTDSTSIPSSASFSFTWAEILVSGHRYEVHYYADQNADGACTLASDQAWKESVAAVTADVNLSVTRRSTFDDVCASFTSSTDGGSPDSSTPPPWDLTITGTGFGAHGVTNDAYAVVLDDGGALVSSVLLSTITDGFFTFVWTDLTQPSVHYHVRFFSDLDSDGECEINEGGFEADVGEVTGNYEMSLVGSMTRTQVCTTFNPATDAGTADSAVAADASGPADAASGDAGVSEDAGASVDATSSTDAALEDAAVEDGGLEDAGSEDA